MKKVLAITCLLVLLVASMGVAAENSWRIYLKADDGAGAAAAPQMTIGVYPTSSDLVDTQDIEAAIAQSMPTNRWAVGVMGTTTYNKDVKSPAAPATYANSQKIWDLRVAALSDADSNPIRLLLTTIGGTVLPPATVGGKDMVYKLVMVDNKGVANAPTNGTVWAINMPTVHSTTPFWSIATAADVNGVVWGNLPSLKLAMNSHSGIIAGGYQMAFIQEEFSETVVPEPGSLLALGSGLVGLAGFAARRRRA